MAFLSLLLSTAFATATADPILLPVANLGNSRAAECHIRVPVRRNGTPKRMEVITCDDSVQDHVARSVRQWRFRVVRDRAHRLETVYETVLSFRNDDVRLRTID